MSHPAPEAPRAPDPREYEDGHVAGSAHVPASLAQYVARNPLPLWCESLRQWMASHPGSVVE